LAISYNKAILKLIHVIYLWRRVKTNNKHRLTNWHQTEAFLCYEQEYNAQTRLLREFTQYDLPPVFDYANHPTRNSNPTITRNIPNRASTAPMLKAKLRHQHNISPSKTSTIHVLITVQILRPFSPQNTGNTGNSLT